MEEKKYWLRGGVIGIILNFFYSLTTLLCFKNYFGFFPGVDDPFGFSLVLWLFFHPHDVPILYLLPKLGFNLESSLLSFTQGFLISMTLTGFILGIIGGWLYGKIKNRKINP